MTLFYGTYNIILDKYLLNILKKKTEMKGTRICHPNVTLWHGIFLREKVTEKQAQEKHSAISFPPLNSGPIFHFVKVT
jgi:hypothetical protein